MIICRVQNIASSFVRIKTVCHTPHGEFGFDSIAVITAKFEDRECNVPQPPELQLLVPHRYPLKDYLAIEAIILEFFG